MEANERLNELRRYLTNLGLTQDIIAKRFGVTKQAINSLLTGRKPFGKQNAIKWANEFGLNAGWLLTGEGEMVKQSTETVVDVVEHGTPVYNIDATCGDLSRPIVFADEHIIGHVNLPNVSPTAAIIRANGDSMEPHIHDGDWIAVREVANLDVLFYGQVYLVITNEYRLLKYLRRDEDEKNYVILRSDNKEYDDIRLPKAEIRHLFIVENILSLHIKL
jgi:phage repressor protein C with HTH and peptisase S24 domain